MDTKDLLHSDCLTAAKIRDLCFTISVLLLAGCSGKGANVLAVPNAQRVPNTPTSVSPSLIPPAPMAKTAIQPSSVMESVKPQAQIQGLTFTQIPGSASSVAVAADGSLWALSSQPSGKDKYIWHYANGNWTNISGLASALAAAPNGTLYAINSGGGTWAYSSGSWTPLGGGAQAITAASDNSVYVLSNGGSSTDRAIWHNVSGTWTQVAGSGISIAASWDSSSYSTSAGTIGAGGLYIINSVGAIWYENTNNTFANLPGSASATAPSISGGLFVLGYPTNPNGNAIYYYDYGTSAWAAQIGAGVSIATDGKTLYVVSANGGIYSSPVRASTTPSPTPSPTTNGTGQPLTGPSTYQSSLYGSLWGPTAVANAFDFPVQHGWNGSGVTVAVIMDAPISGTDLGRYMSYFQTPQTGRSLTYALIDGGPTSSADADEAALDVETIAGLAPGANVILYETPGLSLQTTIDALNSITSNHTAQVVSYSAAGCEYAGVNTTVSPILQAASNAGIALVASSGDQGSDCYNSGQYQFGVGYPASDPNVIGVGGTETANQISAPVNNPVAWNDFYSTKGQEATGGGVSAFFLEPSFQTDLFTSTHRIVPDVAMPAASDAVSVNGAWTELNGTSWSAPQIAALTAEIYQFCNTTFQAPASIFYYSAAVKGYSDFIDVTSGNNSWNGSAYYSAAVGYDPVSGIGVPLGMSIALTVCPGRVPLNIGKPNGAASSSWTGAIEQIPPLEVLHTLPDNGEAAAQMEVQVVVVLKPSQANQQNETTVVTSLQNAGYVIKRRYPNHLVIDAEATASVVEKYFDTSIHTYVQNQYGTRFANATELTIPRELQSIVSGAVTDNIVLFHAPRQVSLAHSLGY